jgi:hypothetical protein
MNIATAGNSDTACLQAVLEKGFKITSIDAKDFRVHLVAKRDDIVVAAESGMALLGLVCLVETYGKNWKDLLEKKPYDQIEYE